MPVNVSVTLDGRGRPVDAANPLPGKLSQGELVRVSVMPYAYGTYVAGDASVTYAATAHPANQDGTQSAVTLSTPSGTSQGCSLKTTLYGKVIGVRFRRDASTPDFNVIIDGVAYAVDATPYKWNSRELNVTLGGVNVTDGDAYQIIADGLDDGPHAVEVALSSDPAAASTYTLVLYGFLVERRVGYQERTKIADVYAVGEVPTAVGIIGSGNVAANTYRALRKMIYTNTTAAAITVTVYRGATVVWQQVLAANTAAGCSAEFDLGEPVTNDSTSSSFRHMAGAAGVNYIAIERA